MEKIAVFRVNLKGKEFIWNGRLYRTPCTIQCQTNKRNVLFGFLTIVQNINKKWIEVQELSEETMKKPGASKVEKIVEHVDNSVVKDKVVKKQVLVEDDVVKPSVENVELKDEAKVKIDSVKKEDKIKQDKKSHKKHGRKK